MTNHRLFFILFLICALLLGTALYFQYAEGLEPCPLCIFQRVAFILVGLICLAGCVHRPKRVGQCVYAVFAGIAGLIGAALAARHVWIQNLPTDQVPECGPGLDYMLDVFPFTKMLATVLRGSGECADVLWTLFGISMPGWSLIWLVALSVGSFSILFRPQRGI